MRCGGARASEIRQRMFPGIWLRQGSLCCERSFDTMDPRVIVDHNRSG